MISKGWGTAIRFVRFWDHNENGKTRLHSVKAYTGFQGKEIGERSSVIMEKTTTIKAAETHLSVFLRQLILAMKGNCFMGTSIL